MARSIVLDTRNIGIGARSFEIDTADKASSCQLTIVPSAWPKTGRVFDIVVSEALKDGQYYKIAHWFESGAPELLPGKDGFVGLKSRFDFTDTKEIDRVKIDVTTYQAFTCSIRLEWL